MDANLFNANVKSDLKEVPETTLWTLHNRASEAMREDGILKDPLCIKIYKSINYEFEKNFGKSDASHAIRSKAFDLKIQQFLAKKPNGLAIGLGEGLETQAQRCDNGKNRWLSVDLPEAIRFREQFIAPSERFIHLEKSATDLSVWDQINEEEIFITAQGLFMYFSEADVKKLLQFLDQRFQKFHLMFDIIPKWLSKKTMKGWQKTPHYKTPAMPWGIDVNHVEPTLKSWIPSLKTIQIVDYEFPRGALKHIVPILKTLPIIRYKRPAMVFISK